MSLLTMFLLAVGLGVDAFSVAIGIGASNNKKSWAPVLRLSLAFGLFPICHAANRLVGRCKTGRYKSRRLITGLLLRFWYWLVEK